MPASGTMTKLRSRLVAWGTGLAAALAATVTLAWTVAPAYAAGPAYTINDVTRAWFYIGGPPDITKCVNREDNPLVLTLDATVQDSAVPAGEQVSVTGLRAALYSGGALLGTVKVAYAYLQPGDPQGSFAEISCRAWGPLRAKGFGGPRAAYDVKILGPGQAHDMDAGAPAGTVTAPDASFPVTIKQIVRTTNLKGTKVGDGVKINTTLQAWGKAAGRYAWQPARKVKVTLLKLKRGKFRAVTSTTTSRTGAFSVRFAAGRDNYVQFKVPGHTSDQSTYWVKRSGEISLAGR